jgi:hypothetical protein
VIMVQKRIKAETKPKTKTSIKTHVNNALEAGKGILRMAPCWVPRSFLMPGKRMRLAEEDLYAYGANRGGIDERWFASTTKADNGPGTLDDEGLSYAVGADGKKFLLIEAVAAMGKDLIGAKMMKEWGRWPLYCKFFDNMGPIPHHLHQLNKHVQPLGREHKPEAYYFPKQYNALGNNFPYTFMGLEPGTTKEQIYECLERWEKGDNGILNYTKAYKLQPGTGWLIPPGILHAPGSLCTYEVQWGSDVFAMYQNFVEGRYVHWDLLTKDVPKNKRRDLDYIIDMIDWEPNVTTHFKDENYLEPILSKQGDGWEDKYVIYGKVHGEDLFSAKELTVQPGASVKIKDNGACGLLLVQGCGKVGVHDAATPVFIRFGDLTSDEYFVTDETARGGYTIKNTGDEPLVILRYFGPGVNSDMPNVGDHKHS